MPAAAPEASAPGVDRSTRVTAQPALASSKATLHPMTPAPTTRTFMSGGVYYPGLRSPLHRREASCYGPPAMADNVVLSRDGVIATVTLNRPDRRNALSDAMLSDLAAAFVDLRDDPTS